MRMLIISPSFVPLADSEAICGGKFALALLDAGVDVEIITCSNFRGGTRLDESSCWGPLASRTHDVRVPEGRDLARSLGCALRYESRSFARWIGAALDAATLLHRIAPFDLVQSRSLPMTAHIAGYWITRSLGVPWVANVNDPWDFHLFPNATGRELGALERRISDFWLRRTLRSADLVSYPSAWLRNYHQQLTGMVSTSLVVPHAGWSRARRWQTPSPCGCDAERPLHLVHTGKLGANELTGRSAATLLHGVREFLRLRPGREGLVRLSLVGPEDAGTSRLVAELGLGEVVQAVGTVSYEESLQWIASATAAVLVEGEMQRGIYLPSKLADYLAASRPVLAFSPARGVVAELAARSPAVTRVEANDVAAVVRALDRFSAAPLPADTQLASEFAPAAVAGRFLWGLEAVSARRRAVREPDAAHIAC